MLVPSAGCKLSVSEGCLVLGVFHYQPERDGLILNYHLGYLPGSRTIAVMDSFGGVTVVTKSGADKLEGKPEGEWVVWIFKRLSLYYTLQGRLPILEKLVAPLH